MRTGVDIVDLSRISLDKKFMEKIACQEEIEYIKGYKTAQKQTESLGGLWAAKEAVIKMLELGESSGVSFKNITILHKTNGKPYVELNGVALDAFKSLKMKECDISISHEKCYAIAFAVGI